MTAQEQVLAYINEETEQAEKEATHDREALAISKQALAVAHSVDGDEFLNNLEKELKSRNHIR